MKGTTPKKGRPTPTAPQNRRRPVVEVDDTSPVLTPEQEAQAAQRNAYRAYRKATRFWRRAFRGVAIDQRIIWRYAEQAQARLVSDGRLVRKYVNDQLGGVEDVVKISQGLGLGRGRVRLILRKGLAR